MQKLKGNGEKEKTSKKSKKWLSKKQKSKWPNVNLVFHNLKKISTSSFFNWKKSLMKMILEEELKNPISST